MTIPKTYLFQVVRNGESIEVRRKGKTIDDALDRVGEEFETDSLDVFVSISGRLKDSRWKRHYREIAREVQTAFPYKLNRFGEYVYRQKGRKVKGRPNYQGNRYGARSLYDLDATFFNLYSSSIAELVDLYPYTFEI